MNRPHVMIAHRGQNLPRLERVLQRCGCRLSTAADDLSIRDKPDLLLVDAGLKERERVQLAKMAAQRHCPVVEMTDHLRLHSDGLPDDILAFVESLQQYLQRFPRRELRIRRCLPVLIAKDGETCIGQILNLSAGGVFMKNGKQAKVGARVLITVPLLGMRKELEATGRVQYLIEASQENGFRHGFGIAFQNPSPVHQQLLREYIRLVLEQDPPDAVDISAPEPHERAGDPSQMRSSPGPSLAFVMAPPALKKGGNG
jgi:Tfp pilus assembly protein PilZ